MTEVTVYRAITGPRDVGPDGNVFKGVSIAQLRERGICCVNNSFAQSGEVDYFNDMGDITGRVEGLPVFMNEDEALRWLEGKRIRDGLAVLASAAISLSAIEKGTIKIWGNEPGGRGARWRIQPETLREHAMRRTQIRGECHIPSAPVAALLESSTFFIPRAHHLDGTIDFAAGFIDLAELQ